MSAMKRTNIIWIVLAILIVAFIVIVLTTPLLFSTKTPTTWFVRPDGGTRYSVNHPEGQCDGKSDTAYSGTGTNQACAFNDYRWLYDDTSFPGTNHWVIAGGDRVIIRGCAGPASPACRIGSDLQAGSSWCPGIGNAGCYNPPIPAGTAAQHTQILGANFSACTSNSAKQEMFGGWGLGVGFNLTATQYVDISCINLTRHSQCIFFGSPAVPPACNRDFPNEDDYVDSGIATSNTTAELNLTDVWVHGFLSRGVIGPIGGRVTCLRCNIDTNGGAGWDFDDGNSTAMGPGANWEFLYSTIQWSGCNQQYPAVDPIPVASCYSQSTGGYGDAVGSPIGTGLSMNIAHSSFIYNTQDALDGGHVDTGGPYSLSVTNSFFAHNGGSNSPKFDHKFGTLAQPAVVTGNVMIGDGARLAAPIPGVPLAFNKNLSDFCRAGDTFPYNFDTDSATVVGNNTIIGYCPVMIDNSCNAAGGCPNAKSQIFNNIFVGYAFLGAPCGGSDPPCQPGYASYPRLDYGGTNIGPSMYFYQNGGPGQRDYRNNIYFQTRQGCPTGFDNGMCTSPMLAGQPTANGVDFVPDELDVFGGATPNQTALQLVSGSPGLGTGMTYPQLPTADIFGNAVSSPPNIGAANPAGSSPPPTLTSITATPNPGSVVMGANLAMTCTAGYSDFTSGTCVTPTWTATAPHASVNASTGQVTGVSVGASTITATIGSVSGNATVNVTSSTPPPNPSTPVVVGGVSITPATGISITNTNVINGHVAFTVTTTAATTQIVTVLFKNNKLKYLSCGVVGNGEVNPLGLSWAAAGSNTLSITVQNALQPGVALNVHVDCWTA